ncbi:hypothetical protein [Pseudomonas sp. 18173]|uniref:hypothetical protein n=1 Tax=Pseudomonas sp. 18173 TaxID=3390055 RepID=UPI003D259F23
MRRLEVDSVTSQEKAESLLEGFEGFLLQEATYPRKVASGIYCAILKMLSLCFGFPLTPNKLQGTNSTRRINNSITTYESTLKDEDKRIYYQGWFIPCQSGELTFINLSKFYLQYGKTLTNYYLARITKKLSRYSHHSVKSYTECLKFINNSLYLSYSTNKELQDLKAPLKVNNFTEKSFTYGLLKAIASENDLKSYYKTWARIVGIFEKVLAGSIFVAEPAYQIIAPNFNTSVYSKTVEYDKTLTPIPLTLKDDDALDALKSALEQNRDYIIKVCRKTCAQELARYRRSINAAKRGKVISHDDNPANIDCVSAADLCATWHKSPYFNKQLLDDLNIPSEVIQSSVYTLRSQTLLPFLYLLNIEHPQITPSWFSAFELYNKKGKMTGFTQAGKGYKARSRKARANKIQIISLSHKSTKLFKTIVKLTSEARLYLKKSGGDDWRYLLMGCGTGLAAPTRMKIIPSLKYLNETHIFKRNLLTGVEAAPANEHTPMLVHRLTLRTARADQLVIKYLASLSESAVSKEAGHSQNSGRLITIYIPPAVRHFIMDRWIRQFQNAIIYEVMKNSPYLLKCMDFNNEQELDWFLQNIRPDYDFEINATREKNSNTDEANASDRIYISLNKEKLIVLLSLYEMVTDAIATSKKVTNTAMKWYRIACLVRIAGELANEGALGGTCSMAAAYLLKTTQPSFEIAERLNRVVYGN